MSSKMTSLISWVVGSISFISTLWKFWIICVNSSLNELSLISGVLTLFEFKFNCNNWGNYYLFYNIC